MFTQLVLGLVDAWCIEKENLRVLQRQNTQELIARRLRFGAGDGDLLAQDAVEQRGFADVGATNDRNKTAAMVRWQRFF